MCIKLSNQKLILQSDKHSYRVISPPCIYSFIHSANLFPLDRNLTFRILVFSSMVIFFKHIFSVWYVGILSQSNYLSLAVTLSTLS